MKVLVCIVLALFGLPALAAPPCLPTLGYGHPLQATGYSGSNLYLGENEKFRWAFYFCTDQTGKRTTTKFIGVKSLLLTTLAGRINTIEKSTTPMKAMSTAWTRYVIDPIDGPLLAEGTKAMDLDIYFVKLGIR